MVKQAGNKLDKLRQMINEGKAEEKAEIDVVEQTTESGEENSEPLEEGNLNTFWQLYIAQLEQQGKRSLSVIYKNSSVRVENSNTAILTLSSQHEKEMFDDDRINVIPFLRSRLNNFKLEIQVTVNSTIQKTRIFTAEEKFNAMAERNPLLNDLRNRLGLELEY